MFKLCKKCGQQWSDRESFLNDKNITLVGYQVHFEELSLGLFLFNHSCKTTLSIKAGLFTDLYDGPVFTKKATGSKECGEFCLDQLDLSTCSAQCECAYVREIIQIIKHMTKQ